MGERTTIDDRNTVNRIAAMDGKLDEVRADLQLQRAQLVGLGAMMILLGYSIYKLGKMLPA
jgi:hypothetical protein